MRTLAAAALLGAVGLTGLFVVNVTKNNEIGKLKEQLRLEKERRERDREAHIREEDDLDARILHFRNQVLQELDKVRALEEINNQYMVGYNRYREENSTLRSENLALSEKIKSLEAAPPRGAPPAPP